MCRVHIGYSFEIYYGTLPVALDNNVAEISFTVCHLTMTTGWALMFFLMLREGIKNNEAAKCA